MKLIKTMRGMLIGSLVLCSGVANAALIEFESSAAHPWTFDNKVFENVIGDIDLTISTAIFSNSNGTITDKNDYSHKKSRLAVIDSEGLGVTAFSNFDEDTNIDGSTYNDLLIFTFSEAVTLLDITFSNVDSGDDYQFGAVDGETFNREELVEDSGDYQINILSNLFPFDNFVGTTFAIGAAGSGDDFKISSISAIPEPGMLSIFALALTVMGLRLRRSK